MKAILVIDVPSDYGNIADNKAIVTLRNGKLGTSLRIHNVPLKPLPQRLKLRIQKEWITDYDRYEIGYNACLDKIMGETK